MAKRTSEDIQREIEQLKNRKKEVLAQEKNRARKLRTKRLIERGAILEQYIEDAEHYTNDEVQEIVRYALNTPYVREYIRKLRATSSDDSSIKNVTVNDFTKILNKSDIRAIFANGNKAYDLYEKYVFETVGIKAVKLPSTSPANARWNLEKLETAYSGMLKYIAD